MRIDLKVDTSRFDRRIRNFDKRLAFGAVNAINNTAKLAQKSMREEAQRDFEIRKEQFVLRQVAIINPFASVRKGFAYAEISVGQRDRLLLARFEAGGKRTPFTPGAKQVAVPITGQPARPSFAQPVEPSLRITRLRLRKRETKSGRVIWVGAKGTYQVPDVGIFQRQEGEEDSELLYSFENPELDARLGFVDHVRGIAEVWMPRYLEDEIRSANARAARTA